MKLQKLIILFLFMVLCQFKSSCQDLYQALRYIKVGNTLRETKQFSESESYLMKGKTIVENLKNTYWTAVVNENLGLLNRDKQDFNNATLYLKKALGLYKIVGSATSALVISQILSGINNVTNDVYAGIEIASKGVKLSIIEVKYSPTGEIIYSVLKADDVTTNAIEGTDIAFDLTIKTAKTYLDTLSLRRKIPADHIFIVGSSGLSNGLKNMGDNKLGKLQTRLQAELNQPITFITSSKEAELTIRGTLPSSEWNQITVLDIGSGNTKGGYYNDSEFKYIDMLGVSTFTQRIEKAKGNKSFADVCKTIYDDEIKDDLVRSQFAQLPAYQTRNKCYLMGGIVYALTTYLHPGQFNDKQVTFTYNEAKRFRDMAVSDYAKLTNPILTDIDDEKLSKKVQKSIKKLKDETFNQNQLIAGSTLLLGMMEEIKKSDSNKTFVFHRDGYIGWISGVIKDAVEEKYRKNKEN